MRDMSRKASGTTAAAMSSNVSTRRTFRAAGLHSRLPRTTFGQCQDTHLTKQRRPHASSGEVQTQLTVTTWLC